MEMSGVVRRTELTSPPCEDTLLYCEWNPYVMKHPSQEDEGGHQWIRQDEPKLDEQL